MLSREELLKLDISKIKSNGRFVDVTIPKMFYLQENEIVFLREYYDDPTIAHDVVIKVEKPKTYKLVKEQKYTNNKVKSRVKRQRMIPVIIFGTLVFISVSFIAPKLMSNNKLKDYESSGIIYEEPTVQDIRDELERYSVEEEPVYLTNNDDISEITNRIGSLMYFCNVYQVDFNTVYNQLKTLTNNFTSDDYKVKHHIDGVTCKGEEIYASSEEELLLFFVRCCKQIPSKVGLSTENLYVNCDFDDSMNYYQNIYYCSNLVGVDPCLVYGIVMSESGLKSNLFIEDNNPAGLRDPNNPNDFWKFGTPEEGIFETCLEIRKFNKRGLIEIADIGSVYCPVGGKDAPYGVNNYWVKNVTYNTNYAKEHFNEVFDIEEYTKR